MDEEFKKNIRKSETWKRAWYMLIFVVLYGVAEVVLTAVVAFQFLSTLFTGRCNDALLKFGKSLAQYIYQIVLFLTFNSEEHPYPLGDWPQQGDSGNTGEKMEQTEIASK